MYIINWWYEGFTSQPGHLVTALTFLTIGTAAWVLRELWLSHKQRRLEKYLRSKEAEEIQKVWDDQKRKSSAASPLPPARSNGS